MKTIVMTTPYVLRYPMLYTPVDGGESECRDAQHHANLERFHMSKVHPLNRCLGEGSQPHCYKHVHTGHPMQQRDRYSIILVPSQMDIKCSTPKQNHFIIIIYHQVIKTGLIIILWPQEIMALNQVWDNFW